MTSDWSIADSAGTPNTVTLNVTHVSYAAIIMPKKYKRPSNQNKGEKDQIVLNTFQWTRTIILDVDVDTFDNFKSLEQTLTKTMTQNYPILLTGGTKWDGTAIYSAATVVPKSVTGTLEWHHGGEEHMTAQITLYMGAHKTMG